ncbi:monovalent cation/H+ antiporter subunit A, partial [Pseudidiomarina aestuarii]
MRQHSRLVLTGITFAIAAVSFILMLTLLPQTLAGEVPLSTYAWLPDLGLNLSFRLDGLSLLFVTLISGIGLLIIFYAHYYLSAKDDAGRFYACLLLFMGSMLGIVTANNMILMWLFWELTSISSFL